MPRDWLENPKDFGRVAQAKWKDIGLVPPDERAEFFASRVQHDHVVVVRNHVTGYRAVALYAERTGQSYQRTAALFRGTQVMTIEDLVRARLIVGEYYFQDVARFIPRGVNLEVL